MKKITTIAGQFVFLSLLAMVFTSKTSAQTVDSSFLKEFNAFNQQINQEFSSFVSHNDSVFLLFLQNSWKEFEGKQNPRPVSPKPVIQPVIGQPLSPLNPEDSLVKTGNPDTTAIQGQEINMPEKESMDNLSTGKSFLFYGNRIQLPLSDIQLPELTAVSRQGIINYFLKASRSQDFMDVTSSLKSKAINYKLNDWGYASLLLKASRSYYASANEQALFTWVALLHQGYNVKVGYSNSAIYLLMPSDVQLYTVSYTIGIRDYFFVGPGSAPSSDEKVFIHEADYPGNKPVCSFIIKEIPQFGYLETLRTLLYNKPLLLNLNKNLIEFYRSYPPCELGVYFNAPLSINAMQKFDAYFLPLLEGKSDNQRVDLLLDYVQHAIHYLTDREQFGKERYLFPDETLFYPAADCEDRSILLVRLLSRYTKVPFIGLSYPAHITLAVNLDACPGNDFVIYNEKRFYIADPTYLGASCGMAMTAIQGETPEIIYQNF